MDNEKITRTDIICYVLIAFFSFVAFGMIHYGVQAEQYNYMAIAMIGIFISNMVIFAINIKKRMLILLFYCMILLFLISRVIIPLVQGGIWWTRYSVEANIFGIYAISISLIFLAWGMMISEILCSLFGGYDKSKQRHKKIIKIDRTIMLMVCRIILIICMICFFYKEIDKLLFMQGRVYEDYYTQYHTRVPFIVSVLASCMQFVLCAFLALKPTKKESFVWLAIHIFSAIPMLIIGARNPLILNCLFAFVYYYLRDFSNEVNQKKWIGRKEKALLICLIPLLVISMGALNYIRADKDVDTSVVYLAMDFVYKQGTTYDTLLQGYQYQDELPWNGNQTYTLGAITDTFFYNFIGEQLFDLEEIGDGNCIRRVYNGHTFSHAISYTVLGKRYIAGEGRGSSYIIENYIDGGYIGVAVFSFILGSICTIIPILFGTNWLLATVSLSALLNFFFTPRAESTAFITFLVSYKYWSVIIGIWILCYLLTTIGRRKGVMHE